MRLAIMQPYFFPYLGYFQLIHAVDAFVVYDDVNFIKRGWINRNNLLAKDKAELVTLQLSGASQNKLINQVSIGNNRIKILKNVIQKYSKAPYYKDVFPMIEDVMNYSDNNLAIFLDYSLRSVCDYLSLKPKWILSSQVEKDNTLKGQDKILSICKSLGASHYINPPGGKQLYDTALFQKKNIELSFIETKCLPYNQFSNEFVSHLSMIDVMMFNNREQCQNLLQEYSLV